jgi:hypothetical protein
MLKFHSSVLFLSLSVYFCGWTNAVIPSSWTLVSLNETLRQIYADPIRIKPVGRPHPFSTTA